MRWGFRVVGVRQGHGVSSSGLPGHGGVRYQMKAQLTFLAIEIMTNPVSAPDG